MKKTIISIAQLESLVAVSYRKRRDVEEWLELNPLGIKIADLICKPGTYFPPPIDLALDKLECKSYEAIAICADALEVMQAHLTGVGAVLVTPLDPGPVPHRNPFDIGPDFIFHAGQDASNIYSSSGRHAGYVGEVLAAAGLTPVLQKLGSVKATTLDFENPEAPNVPIHVCGRYFAVSDFRYNYHPLSLRLINAKRNPDRQADLVAAILSFWIRVEKPGTVVMACVPQKPGEAPNLLAKALGRLRAADVTAAPDLLECRRDYPKQKEAGSYEARRENVKGVLGLRGEVRNKQVVVVDDITTSFSTLNEAREVLLREGASRVFLVAIGFHPQTLKEGPRLRYPNCSACTKPAVVRYNTKDGTPFFACEDIEAYKQGKAHPAINFRKAFEDAIRLEDNP